MYTRRSERESSEFSLSSSPLADYRDSSHWISECLESLNVEPETLLKGSRGLLANEDRCLNKPVRSLWSHGDESPRTTLERPGKLNKQPALPSDKLTIDFGAG
jgi:hypothetical protein